MNIAQLKLIKQAITNTIQPSQATILHRMCLPFVKRIVNRTPMMPISSEANIHDQLLNCQTNLSPFSRNNVGTNTIPKRTKANNAIPIIADLFILLLVLFHLQEYNFFS